MIRKAKKEDMVAISEIYNHYVETSIATFDTKPSPPQKFILKYANILEHNLPWLVAEHFGEVVGYCYATPWKERPAYQYSVEISVYVAPQAARQGWASKLYHELFEQLSDTSIHAVMAGISLPNDASVRLHEGFGMSKVAHFEQVGFKFSEWVDVGYWQKILPQ